MPERNCPAMAIRSRTSPGWVASGSASLPEIFTDVSAALMHAPDLAAGDLFGSNMANMLILGIIDLMHRQKRVWQ